MIRNISMMSATFSVLVAANEFGYQAHSTTTPARAMPDIGRNADGDLVVFKKAPESSET